MLVVQVVQVINLMIVDTIMTNWFDNYYSCERICKYHNLMRLVPKMNDFIYYKNLAFDWTITYTQILCLNGSVSEIFQKKFNFTY